MGLSDSLEKMKFDSRLIEWNLNHGVLKKDEVKKHSDSLPDVSSLGSWVSMETIIEGEERDTHSGLNGNHHPTHS